MGGVVHRVPHRLGGRPVRGVADPGGGAAGEPPYVDLGAGRRAGVGGVRQPRAVGGDRGALLVRGGVGEPGEAAAVGADPPQVALGAAAAAAGLGRVEDHRGAVGRQPRVRGVPAGGELAHRAVGRAQIDLRARLVAPAGEDQQPAEGRRLDVEVRGARAEERGAGAGARHAAQAAVPGPCVRDPVVLARGRVGRPGVGGPGVRCVRPGRAGARAGRRGRSQQRDHQQQRHACSTQAVPTGVGVSGHVSSQSGAAYGCDPPPCGGVARRRQGGGAVSGGSADALRGKRGRPGRPRMPGRTDRRRGR